MVLYNIVIEKKIEKIETFNFRVFEFLKLFHIPAIIIFTNFNFMHFTTIFRLLIFDNFYKVLKDIFKYSKQCWRFKEKSENFLFSKFEKNMFSF